MKAKAALTKKDLIVVLACGVFLLANIAAVGPRGRRHAKQMLCLSNLHKWGIIFQQFAADNDGYFMRGWFQSFDNNYPINSDYWMEALRPYYGNEHKLRCCPEATVPSSEINARGEYYIGGTFTAWGVLSSWGWEVWTPGDYGSYGMNSWVCNPPQQEDSWPPILWNWRTANVAGAENVPLFTDNQWIDGWPTEFDDPPAFEGEPFNWGSQMGRFCINRHEGFINSAFLDFSARKIGLKELWTLKWHRSFLVDGPWTIAGGVTRDNWANHGTGWMKDFKDY